MSSQILRNILVGVGLVLCVCVYVQWSDESRPPVLDREDGSTFSNYKEIVTEHVNLDVSVTFEEQVLHGSVTLTMRVRSNNGLSVVQLDMRGLRIYQVHDEAYNVLRYRVNNKSVELGDQLEIELGRQLVNGSVIQLIIFYQTTQNSTAVQWLQPEQTTSKRYPFMFTQCEPIHCRSLAPLQDTPSIKATYTASLKVPKPLVGYMSAKNIQSIDSRDEIYYFFEQNIPVASYLIAIAVGDLREVQVGKRTRVIAEPEVIVPYSTEFEDLELLLEAVESYSTPYEWEYYSILFLPASFPYGGMENPLLTFMNPAFYVGDKSYIGIATHEISHSWTGNLVTNGNWQSFWLNEGMTVFLERKATKKLKGDENYRISVYQGYNGLLSDIETYGNNSTFTSLNPDIRGRNPDDAFSAVPYEKGFQFLVYLESKVGENKFQEIFRKYIYTYRKSSVTASDFIGFFIQEVKQRFNCLRARIILRSIKWDLWINQPGPPPNLVDYSHVYIIKTTQDLADSYVKLQGDASPDKFQEFLTFSNQLKSLFLDQILTYKNQSNKLNLKVAQRLYSDYSNVLKSNNIPIFFKWLRICILTNYSQQFTQVELFLATVGRLNWVRALYRDLTIIGKYQYALQLYYQNKPFYHPLLRTMIEKDLKLI